MHTEREDRLERMLSAWSTTAQVEGQVGGGHRNRIWAVRIGGRRYAARLSTRPDATLDWEIQLLDHLYAAGMSVPAVLRTRDGRARVDGLILFSWLDGHPPASESDWRLVTDQLTRLHELTTGWSQRPLFRSSLQLLEEPAGGDVDLDVMPEDVVRRVRDAWRAVADGPISVVHGDPGAGNIRRQGGRVGLIDWDEARVDVSLLDLAALPLDFVPVVGQGGLALARRAAIAWEVANGWVPEPAYAQRRLAELDSMPER